MRHDLSDLNGDSVDNDIDGRLNVLNPTNMFKKEDATTARDRDSANSADFWVAYMVGAFQPSPVMDADGAETFPPVLGRTINGGHDSGSILFRETLRDVHKQDLYAMNESDLWAIAAVHESGHLFHLEHKVLDGAVMIYEALQAVAKPSDLPQGYFWAQGLLKIAKTPYPGS